MQNSHLKVALKGVSIFVAEITIVRDISKKFPSRWKGAYLAHKTNIIRRLNLIFRERKIRNLIYHALASQLSDDFERSWDNSPTIYRVIASA